MGKTAKDLNQTSLEQLLSIANSRLSHELKDLERVRMAISSNEADFRKFVDFLFDGSDASRQAVTTAKSRTLHFFNFAQIADSSVWNADILNHFKNYIIGLPGYKTSTKNAILSVVSSMFKQMYKKRILNSETGYLRRPRLIRESRYHAVNGTPPEELIFVAKKLRREEPSLENLRDRVILTLLVRHGLRCSEVSSVKRERIGRNHIWIKQKGFYRDEVQVFLHPGEPSLIRQYTEMDHPAQKTETETPLILGAHRKNGVRVGANPENIARYYRKIFVRLRVPVAFSWGDKGIKSRNPHGARHTYCTGLLSKYNGDLELVRKKMRLQSYQTILKYNDDIDTVGRIDFDPEEGIEF